MFSPYKLTCWPLELYTLIPEEWSEGVAPEANPEGAKVTMAMSIKENRIVCTVFTGRFFGYDAMDVSVTVHLCTI
jgi:hypothetical protein